MDKNNQKIGEAYYTALAAKDMAFVEKHLHPDVEFIGPLDELKGKKAVLEATSKFASFFNALKIRSTFGSGNQAVIIYDVDFPEPMGSIRGVSLMTFEEGIATKIELFYDGRPVERMKKEIFSEQGGD